MRAAARSIKIEYCFFDKLKGPLWGPFFAFCGVIENGKWRMENERTDETMSPVGFNIRGLLGNGGVRAPRPTDSC